MKLTRYFSIFLMLGFMLATPIFVQAQSTGKIGLIDTFAWGDKGGITKYINAQARLNAEFKKEIDALNAKAKTIQARRNELQQLRQQKGVALKTIQDKASVLAQLERTAKFTQENLQARVNKRRGEIVQPILNDIFKVLQTYATQKGYAMILDGARLEQSGILISFNKTFDVTKDFITYYNTRSGGTASTTK